MRVLVVEDERRLADLLARGLREAGHIVDVRHTGPEGLEAALDGDHDSVVLDVMLPGLDGMAATSSWTPAAAGSSAGTPKWCSRHGSSTCWRRC